MANDRQTVQKGSLRRGGCLTDKRLRSHGLILGVVLWTVYIWVLATPGLRDRNGNLKGTDFLHFYTLGTLSRERSGAELYDMAAQAQVAAQRVPAAAGIRYLPLYPPQVSLIFAPLARLSYGWALALWWMVTAVLYMACCYSIFRVCSHLQGHRATVAILAVANPAFFHLIAWGQTSGLALACFTLMFFAMRRKLDFLAGVCLGCLIFKPQLALASTIVFVVLGAWKVWAGSVVSAAAQLAVGVMYYGVAPFRQWLGMMWHVRSAFPWLEPRPYQTHCLRTFWSMLVPSPGVVFILYLASAVVMLVITSAIWKRMDNVALALRFPALLLASVLVAPHLTVYDLVILAPAFLLVADWLVADEGERRSTLRPYDRGEKFYDGGHLLGYLLYLVYVLPLVGPLARWTHVQLSVIAMGTLLFLIWRCSSEQVAHSVENGKIADAKSDQEAGSN